MELLRMMLWTTFAHGSIEKGLYKVHRINGELMLQDDYPYLHWKWRNGPEGDYKGEFAWKYYSNGDVNDGWHLLLLKDNPFSSAPATYADLTCTDKPWAGSKDGKEPIEPWFRPSQGGPGTFFQQPLGVGIVESFTWNVPTSAVGDMWHWRDNPSFWGDVTKLSGFIYTPSGDTGVDGKPRK